jgi:hypothetical protein
MDNAMLARAAKEKNDLDWKLRRKAAEMSDFELQHTVDACLNLIVSGELHGATLEGAKILATTYAKVLLRRQGREV